MKTKLIQKIKEEYFKGQPTRDLLFEGKESPRAEFGYKVRRGNEIFTVVDWGNIWNFIEKAISQSKEELMEEIKKKYPCRFCGNSGRVWSSIGNFVPCNTENDCILEDLNKK